MDNNYGSIALEKLIKKQIFDITDEGLGFLQYYESREFGTQCFKRIYFILGTKELRTRGNHAHKKLSQVMVCIQGVIKVEIENLQGNLSSVVLDSPNIALIVKPLEWSKMTWVVENSILLVLADDNYDELDYIRSYDEFKSYRLK